MRSPAARSIVDAGLAAALASTLAIAYASVVKGLALEWASSPDSSYGVVLAAGALWIAWRRRGAFVAAQRPDGPRAAGLAVLIAGSLLFAAGQLGADVFLTRLSLVAVAAGLVWFLAGAAIRVAAAPLVLLLLAIPLPALIVNAITLPLQLVASRIAEQLLVAFSVPVFRDGNVLELRTTTLEVAQACSGLRSLISLTAVAALIAWSTERILMRRALVVFIATPLAVALNGVRIAATGVACETWGRHMATGGWHETAGWLTFVVGFLSLVAFQRVLPRRRDTSVLRDAQWVSA